MSVTDAATVDNSIGRLLSKDKLDRAEAAVFPTEASGMMRSITEDHKLASGKVPSVRLSQSAPSSDSLAFLQDRLTGKSMITQPLVASEENWRRANLAAPQGVHPVEIGDGLEGGEGNAASRLDASVVPTFRDASSPEIDTDISRTSSTSTKGSSGESSDLNSVCESKLRLNPEVPDGTGLAPGIVLKEETKKQSHEGAEIEAQDKAHRLNVRRLHSILELLETERNYTEDLDLLVNVFFVQLRSIPYFAENGQRLRTVVRNADQLLDLHRHLTLRLTEIVERATAEDAPNDSADHAVIECANAIAALAPRFGVYKEFCARHKEALAHIDTVEQRTGEWELFRQRSSVAANNFLAKSSDNVSRSEQGVSPRVMTQRRLLFRDFFIKPIQRLCLYPIILQTMQKNSPGIGHEELSHTIDLMRNVTLDVDSASKQRESALLTEMITSRLETNSTFSHSLLTSLGECKMSGNLDVLHHHNTLAPLTVPLPVKYYGCFLFGDFMLMVKVRRNHSFTARYWFPLAETRLERTDAHADYLPHAFRLSVRGHHFELIASTAKECHLWLSALEDVFQRGPSKTRSLNGAEIPFPCNLPIEHSAAKEAGQDPLVDFLSHRALSTDSQTTRGRLAPSSTHSEILLRHKSPPRRAAIDRGMLFSDACISARTSLDNDGFLSHTTQVGPSSLSSTMGAIVNLSRLSGSETLSLKVPSRALSQEDTTPTQTPQMGSVSLSSDPSPNCSPLNTATSSPTLRSSFSEDTNEPQGRSLRRRVRESFSRRSSVQLDANEVNAAQEQAALAQAISRRSSLTGLGLRSNQVNEVGQLAKGTPLTLDTSSHTLQNNANPPRSGATSARSVRNPKGWFLSSSSRSSSDETDTLSSPFVPSGTLKRSSSLNWSALRARNWSTTSLKSLASRRGSVDLDGDVSESESRTSRSSFSEAGRSPPVLTNQADSVLAPSSRASSPKRKFAMRFLQRNRLSPMAPPNSQTSPTHD